MKYAVITVTGKQYRVSEGDRIIVDKINHDQPVKVMLLREEEKILIGKPYLDKVKVSFEKENVVKGKKIEIVKYKAKSRYRKHIGFRAQYSPLIIKNISS
jgi:large subunit ribosomal protein L21